jgi:hypothetical protein
MNYIKPDKSAEIFKSFERLHAVDESAGTGIGLAVYQTVIERHGGKIWAESTPVTSIGLRLILVCTTIGLSWCATLRAQQSPPELSNEKLGARHALIIVGLPGDPEHRKQFTDTTAAWVQWLTGRLGLASENVLVLAGPTDAEEAHNIRAGTRESIQAHASRLAKTLQEEDSLWVFYLGHANYDDEHAYFHLPGPDMNEDDVAEWFGNITCREQVHWLTHTCSGWFLKPLSRPGRIVISATAPDRETNETEFPQALMTVSQRAMEDLDRNHDGRVSIAELFTETAAEVEAMFAVDERAPTEHGQLDDNGDGIGTEAGDLDIEPQDDSSQLDPSVAARVKAADGKLASMTFLPSTSAPERKQSERNETEAEKAQPSLDLRESEVEDRLNSSE